MWFLLKFNNLNFLKSLKIFNDWSCTVCRLQYCGRIVSRCHSSGLGAAQPRWRRTQNSSSVRTWSGFWVRAWGTEESNDRCCSYSNSGSCGDGSGWGNARLYNEEPQCWNGGWSGRRNGGCGASPDDDLITPQSRDFSEHYWDSVSVRLCESIQMTVSGLRGRSRGSPCCPVCTANVPRGSDWLSLLRWWVRRPGASIHGGPGFHWQ